ncbi:MAG: GFA family protein [Pseudomonadales bacterium]|nr:GFA family protein [Pseudomonadales bacterium]
MLKGSCHCGAVHWEFDGTPDSATACNCTVCRRYGALWAYDWENEGIRTSGTTKAYVRADSGDIEFHFCPECGGLSHWRGVSAHPDGRRRTAVNLRLSDPEPVADIPIRHFEGFETFEDLPMDGRCVRDYWF